MSSPSVSPPRRGDARRTILEVAREHFLRSGYDGTSVRDVAAAARVSEGLLYRYFGSKKGLFEEAVTQAYRGYISDFLDQWSELGAGVSNEEVVDRYVRGLYDVVTRNSALLFAVSAADRFGSEGADAGVLIREVRLLAETVAAEARDRGIEHVDLEMAVTCTTALVLAMGLLDNLLFEKAGRPDTERLLREMSRFAAAGVPSRGSVPD